MLPDVGVCKQTELKFAAWNIQRFGQGGEYHRDENEMQEIVKILCKYDLIAITELMKESELQKAQSLLSKMGREYDYLISDQVGWIGHYYQEHYAFLYYKGLVSVVSVGKTGEKKDSGYNRESIKKPSNEERWKYFMRPPFWATFRAGKFDFSVVVIHTQPRHSESECALLDEVYVDVKKANGEEDDVLLVGDFNLVPSKDAFDDLMRSKVKKEDKGTDKDLSTMIALFDEKNHSSMINDGRLNDNIIFQRKYVDEYLRSGVDEFDEKDSRVMVANARFISDHRPVWAVFRTDFIDDDGKKAGDNGNAEDGDTGSDSGSLNNGDSEVMESDSQTSVDDIVYVTRSGAKYHKDSCNSLRRSKIEISLAVAKQKYGPCDRCNPPQ